MIILTYAGEVVTKFAYKKDITKFLKEGLNNATHYYGVAEGIDQFCNKAGDLDTDAWFKHVNKLVKLNDVNEDMRNDLFDLGYVYYTEYWIHGNNGCSNFFKDVLDNAKVINNFSFKLLQ